MGFSPRLRGDIVLNDLVAAAYLTGEVRVLSDGTPWRPLVHARDIAAAFVACLEAPRQAVHDRAFNVGMESENLQVAQIAKIAAAAVPGSTVNITGETGNDPRSYRVDFSRITNALPSFRPEWTAEQGAVELHDAYRRHGLTIEQYRPWFTRLAWLSRLQEEGRLDGELRWTGK